MSDDIAIHPSEIIQDELDTRGWDRTDLAVRMAGDPSMNLLTWDMYRTVGPTDPRMQLGPETAKRIADAFGVSAELFLNLEAAWRARHVH